MSKDEFAPPRAAEQIHKEKARTVSMMTERIFWIKVGMPNPDHFSILHRIANHGFICKLVIGNRDLRMIIPDWRGAEALPLEL